jgi:hypothetical protein
MQLGIEARPMIDEWSAWNATWTERVLRHGFVHLPAESLRGSAISDDQWREFQELWHQLRPDEFMAAGQHGRFRRYGRVRLDYIQDGMELAVLPPAPFHQTAEVMPLHGGRMRTFAPISDETLTSVVMRLAITRAAMIAHSITGKKCFHVGIHMIRVCASGDDASMVTPEGMHRDGHDLVAMHLISRKGCEGGQSLIYGPDDSVTRLCLTDPGESIVLDDRKVQHEVEPVRALNGGGSRDMLLLDFDEPGEAACLSWR